MVIESSDLWKELKVSSRQRDLEKVAKKYLRESGRNVSILTELTFLIERSGIFNPLSLWLSNQNGCSVSVHQCCTSFPSSQCNVWLMFVQGFLPALEVHQSMDESLVILSHLCHKVLEMVSSVAICPNMLV